MKFIEDVSVSYYLDKGRKDKNDKHKVRLQVYSKALTKRKYYSTKFSFTEKEFTSTWETVKPRKEFQMHRKELRALLTASEQVAEGLTPFNFEDFERLMFNRSSAKKDVNFYYSKKIEACKKREAISTAKNYESALICFQRVMEVKEVNEVKSINFVDITVSWLNDFEKSFKKQGKSLTTVGIYLRTLRTIFNDAIEDKTVSSDIYPFGKRKYQLPSPKKVKKALTPQQLKTLFTGNPRTQEQERAKAFWFFSYLCNGMNFKDILHLKCKDFNGEKIEFIRAKTAKSANDQSPITVYPDQYAITILNHYGNPNGGANDYIFNVLSRSETAEEKYRKVKNFIRLINQHFLKYAKDNGINEKISSYWARHSFATMAIRRGASIEQVGEAVGHTDTKTTQGYFAGFEDETKKAIGKNLLDF